MTLSDAVLSSTGESPAFDLSSWGIYNFIGAGRPTLDGVGSTLATAFEQSISVLSFSDNSSTDADLNGDYGFVELSVTYSDVEANALVALNSSVFDLNANGAGSLTAGTNSEFSSSLGLSDGSVGFDGSPVLASNYTVSSSGAVQVLLDQTVNGFADSNGDLITVVGDNHRAYGARLMTGVTVANLYGQTFELHGLVIESSKSALNASDFVGTSLEFSESGSLTAVLSGSVVESRAVFDSADASLPTLRSVNTISNDTSDAMRTASDGTVMVSLYGSAARQGVD